MLLATLCLFSGLVSCSSDDNATPQQELEQLTTEARGFLTGDIVLNIRAFMGETDKTLLPTGCPIIFNFGWSQTDPHSLKIDLKDFSMEGMPYVIKSFATDVVVTSLNSWEQDEYSQKGWIKLEGKDGWLNMQSDNPKIPTVNKQMEGSSLIGYYNALTHEINFKIDFAIMNVTANTILQKVDKSRLSRFDEEKAQYEADYQQAKEEQGLSRGF